MKKFVVKLSYDGKNYYGFQIQPNEITIQGELQKALKQINKSNVKVFASGRTDKGVSAKGQVIAFYLDIKISPSNLKKALNSILKSDIKILEVKYIYDNFEPRYDAIKRKYSYHILNTEKYFPWEAEHAYIIRKKLNILNLNEMAKYLIGTHDFTTFSCKRDKTKSKSKEIYFANFKKKGKFIVFQIIGSSFLWKMVRSIVGTIIDIEVKSESPLTFKEILKSRDRKYAKKTAPANALFLDRVYYE